MEGIISELLAGGVGGSIITMVTQKLLNKRSDKVDVETKVNGLLDSYADKINDKLTEVQENAQMLSNQNIELRLENQRVSLQNGIYKKHLEKCNACDQSSIFVVDK